MKKHAKFSNVLRLTALILALILIVQGLFPGLV